MISRMSKAMLIASGLSVAGFCWSPIVEANNSVLYTTSNSSAHNAMKSYFLSLRRDSSLDQGTQNGWLRQNQGVYSLVSQSIDVEARTLGVKAGTIYAENILKQLLEQASPYLDDVFDTSPYLETHKHWLVVPAIVTEVSGRKTYLTSEKKAFIYADKTYVIMRSPRFADSPPSWRDYVRFNSPVPEIMSNRLLPQTAEEIQRWERAFNEGWSAGIKVAIKNVTYQLTRGLYDLQGMQRYTMLRNAGIVTGPIILDRKENVSGDDTRIELDGGYVEIMVEPKMDHDARNWKTIPSLPPLETLMPRHFYQLLYQEISR